MGADQRRQREEDWMPRGALIAAVLTSVALQVSLGCTITSGGLTADGFAWSWLVTDADGAAHGCADVAADLARLVVTDADGVAHVFDWRCGDDLGAWEAASGDQELATGPASVTAQLIRLVEGASELEEQVLSAGSFTHDLSVVAASNDQGQVQFVVDVWDPQDAADASLLWSWQLGAEWIDDPTAEDYPTNAECAAAGIDYVNLWVWNPEYEQWWSDTSWTQFPCGAYEHDSGGTFAGLWLPEFLNAGSYSFFLGFYAEGDQVDTLVYYDDSRTDVELAPDATTGPSYNDLGGTLIDPAGHGIGVLKVDLSWEQAGGGLADCYESSVAAIGFRLARDSWVAAEVPLSEGAECLDELVFAELPVLEGGYELQLLGLSVDHRLKWYQVCAELEPDGDATGAEDAAARECQISNLAAD
jgi:hypothetical protein